MIAFMWVVVVLIAINMLSQLIILAQCSSNKKATAISIIIDICLLVWAMVMLFK